MTSTYDETGIVLDRYADILARYVALLEGEFGESIDTSEDEYVGHTIRNISLIQGEINEIVQSLYDATKVSAATGVRLDALMELIGLTRSAAAYSTVTLKLTAIAATTVPAGTQYATAAEVIFATDTELVFTGAGQATVEATCTVTGPYNAGINEVTVIKTPIYGISACTNDAAAIPGRDRETDSALKTRHTTAVATSGDQDVASIYEALTAVTGVSAAYVFDNDTQEAIGVVPSKTIRCSVIGGSDADVAEAIANSKTAGVPTYGATAQSVYNTTTRQSKTINFDRAVDTATHIEITLTKYDNYPDDGDAQIKAAIVSHFEDISIDDDVIYNALYQPIYSIPGCMVTALKLDTVDPPTGTSDLTSSPLKRYTIQTSDIDIV